MLKKIILGILGIAVVLLVIGFFLPWGYKVERSVVIKAPPSEIFPLVNNFKEWRKWDPWTKEDKTLKYSYKGVSGVGHSETWVGEASGEGWIEIRESVPNERISMDMDFKQGPPPTSDIILEEQEKGVTKVTWTMVGENGMKPVGNYLGLMMDSWVGGMYEKGLSNLKTLVENKKDLEPKEIAPANDEAKAEPEGDAQEEEENEDEEKPASPAEQ